MCYLHAVHVFFWYPRPFVYKTNAYSFYPHVLLTLNLERAFFVTSLHWIYISYLLRSQYIVNLYIDYGISPLRSCMGSILAIYTDSCEKNLSTLNRMSWVFSGRSGFLPLQGKLAEWVMINTVRKVISQLL
jgi:hypothetical protein